MSTSLNHYCLLGLEALDAHLREIQRQIEPVRAGQDVDALHKLRVASRRFRATLNVFASCVAGKAAKQWNKPVRRIARRLGEARDLDVQIDWLDKYLQTQHDPRNTAGVERLLLRLRQQRELLQRKNARKLDLQHLGGELSKIESTLREIRVEIKLRGKDDDESTFQENMASPILKYLEELLAYEPYVDEPEAVKQLHEMRVAAKHLRYTLEIFQNHVDGSFTAILKRMRKLQTLLGDLHDYDVWSDSLETFLKEEKHRTAKYFGHTRGFARLAVGIEQLKQDYRDRRQQAYEQFRDLWHQTLAQQMFDQLRQFLTPAGSIKLEPVILKTQPDASPLGASAGDR